MADMNFNDFNNRINGNQVVAFNTNIGYGSAPNAFMYIFTPRFTPDVTVRNYEYNFTTPFINDLSTTVDKTIESLNGALGASYYNDLRMINSLEANRSIAPTATGYSVSGYMMSTLYTFLLVIDNAQFRGRLNPHNVSNRLLYSGYFLDEPCAETIGNRTAFNERAMMIITHVTYLNVGSVHSGNGSIIHAVPMTDTDIINPQINLQISPNRGYTLRPSDIIGENFLDGEGAMFFTPNKNYLGNLSNNLKIETSLNNPREHIKTIVAGLTTTIDKNRQNGTISAIVNDDYSFYNTLRTNITVGQSPDDNLGLPLHQNLILAEILHWYPCLRSNTEVLHIPYELPEAPASDVAPTPTNIWTSLLISAIPATMSNFGISDASFRYCSIDPTMIFNSIDRKSAFEVYNLGLFIPQESNSMAISRFKSALDYLEKNVFSIIVAQSGNFDVMVYYSSTKECAVRLNLIDVYDVPNQDITVRNSAIGGFQSPLVGDEGLKEHNALELGNLTQFVHANTNHFNY